MIKSNIFLLFCILYTINLAYGIFSFFAFFKLVTGIFSIFICVAVWMIYGNGRKGILDFLELARMMPKVQFIWFGGGNESLVTAEIKEAISKKPDNVLFAGFVKSDELRDAYCGADVFSFMSYEETEGIVVLEALACEIPTIVRNIPVYEGWLEDEKQVYKAETIKEFQEKITAIFSRDVRLMKKEERKIACNKSLGKVGERLLRLYSEME